jgi:hypothetical protein
MGWCGWIGLGQDRDKWGAFVSAVMKLQGPSMGNSRVVICSIELVSSFVFLVTRN